MQNIRKEHIQNINEALSIHLTILLKAECVGYFLFTMYSDNDKVARKTIQKKYK